MTTTREQNAVHVSAAAEAPEEKQLMSLWIEVEGRTEAFCIARDVRHGKQGFRVLRYVSREGSMEWDERYQFYAVLNDLYSAIESEDYEKGQRAF